MCGCNADSGKCFQSKIEDAILSAHDEPAKLSTSDIITANGETGKTL